MVDEPGTSKVKPGSLRKGKRKFYGVEDEFLKLIFMSSVYSLSLKN